MFRVLEKNYFIKYYHKKKGKNLFSEVLGGGETKIKIRRWRSSLWGYKGHGSLSFHSHSNPLKN
jgi:hypothetical protein